MLIKEDAMPDEQVRTSAISEVMPTVTGGIQESVDGLLRQQATRSGYMTKAGGPTEERSYQGLLKQQAPPRQTPPPAPKK